PSSLDDDEWDAIRQHPEEGTRLAAGLLPWLGEWGRAIGEHHERWDGLGYPNGLAGEEISLSARIVAVADSYEVMTTNRSYGRARSAAVARQELTDCAGAQFDPQVVRSFLSISLGRLRWVFGPLTWLAEVPLVALDRSGQAARLATAALGVGGLVAAGVIAQPTGGATLLASPRPGAAPSPLGLVLTPAQEDAAPAAGSPSTLPSVSASTKPAPTASPSATRAGTAVAAPRPRATVSSPATRPPVTYWFTGSSAGYGLVPLTPTRTGSPPDADGDGHPGSTLMRGDGDFAATGEAQRIVLDRVLDRPLRLSGVPSLALWSRLASSRGNARVQVQLEDCPSAGGCVVLADGQVEDGTWSTGSFNVHDIALTSVDTTVPAGHRLRVVLVALKAGTKADLWVAVGSASAPSRLTLPVL
ncbi:MAG: HD domain-containing phosphohydrolase, partial [Mycobacteriales bacterium]